MFTQEVRMRFIPYSPDQAYLLPPNIEEILGPSHLSLFLRRVVERLDLSAFSRGYTGEGRPPYHPALMVSVWLYAYALGVTSSRRLEQRLREDLGFRYLAGGQRPDHWSLNDFRRRHPKALNDLFTQVLELAREAGLGRLGYVAIDSTRVKASAAADRVDSGKKLRAERVRLRRQIRRWQQACNQDDPNEAPGLELATREQARLEQKLAEIPGRLRQLKKSGAKKRSRTDPDSRFLKQGGKFVLGYTVTVAASEDHLIVDQRVTTDPADSAALLPALQGVKERWGRFPDKTVADSGFFALGALQALERQKLDVYVPDSNLARVLNRGGRLRGRARQAVHRRMRQKLRRPEGRAVYRKRKALVEPVLGVLKEQRGMRQFRRRGLENVAVEMSWATTAYNLTRLWKSAPALARP
jgi:transposase